MGSGASLIWPSLCRRREPRDEARWKGKLEEGWFFVRLEDRKSCLNQVFVQRILKLKREITPAMGLDGYLMFKIPGSSVSHRSCLTNG